MFTIFVLESLYICLHDAEEKSSYINFGRNHSFSIFVYQSILSLILISFDFILIYLK